MFVYLHAVTQTHHTDQAHSVTNAVDMAVAEVVAMAATTKADVSTRNAVMSVRATDVMMTGRVNMVGTVVDNTMVRPLYLAER